MKLGVFGVTRGTGKHLLRQALVAGHQVTAFARNPAVLDGHEQLEIVKGDVSEPGEVEQAVKGQDAVIFCVGPTSRSEPTSVCSTGIRNVIAAMKKHGVKRLIFLSAWGAGDSKFRMPTVARWILGAMVREPMRDKEVAEQMVRNSGLEWVIARPGGLTDKPARGAVKASADASEKRPSMQISREDVATWLLEQAQATAYLGKAPVLGY